MNLISRTILPVTYQKDIFPGAGSQFGLGDASLSLFFSPKEPTSGGVIWGVGPIFLLPTATDSLLGAKKWGAGTDCACAYDARTMDHGCSRQPYLVLCRRQRSPRHQQHLFTAFRGLHIAERFDPIGTVRKHLQLEDRKVVCTHQCFRFQAGQMG